MTNDKKVTLKTHGVTGSITLSAGLLIGMVATGMAYKGKVDNNISILKNICPKVELNRDMLIEIRANNQYQERRLEMLEGIFEEWQKSRMEK